MRHLKKIRETDAGPIGSICFANFSRCLIFEFFFFTNSDVVKMIHLNKIHETNGGKIKKQDVPST